MTTKFVKRTAEFFGKRKVKRLTFKDAACLMRSAQKNERSYRGNIEWLQNVEGKFNCAYLVPARDVRLRSADVRCLLAFTGDGGNYVWLTVDVSPWEILRLPGLSYSENVELIGKLIAGYPSVMWDGSTSDGATPA